MRSQKRYHQRYDQVGGSPTVVALWSLVCGRDGFCLINTSHPIHSYKLRDYSGSQNTRSKTNTHEGTMGSGWELRHLVGSPGGGGVFRLCHTLVRVNTV